MRLTRLAKVFKLLKKNKTILSKLTEQLKISNGFERLAIFVTFFILFIHVAACMFILLGEMEMEIHDTWINIVDLSGSDLYVMAIYFVLTTVSTVGYGDLVPTTTYERLFCVVLMFVGVSAFTFVSGALSSIISNYDQSQAALQEKFLHLNRLRLHYKLSDALYQDVRQALHFGAH